MLKRDLINILKSKKNIIETALNFLYIVASKTWEKDFKAFTGPGYSEIELDSSKVVYRIDNPAVLVSLYANNDYLNNSGLNLYKAVICYSFNTIYESVACYCRIDHTNLDLWEHASWRPLARLIRNSFSHDFRLDFSKKTKKGKILLIDSVSYSFPDGTVYKLNQNEHGNKVNGDNVPLQVILKLIDVMIDFIENIKEDT